VQLIGRSLAHPAVRVQEVPVAFRARAGGTSKVSGRVGPSLLAAQAMMRHALDATRPRALLVLMAKAPRPGYSKTRLAADLDAPTAASFWAACLRDAGVRMRHAAADADLDVAAMTPSVEDAREVRRLTGLPAIAQRAPGLGNALLEVSELPSPFTIAVSGDAPTLPVERLLEAVAALRRAPAVLGPDEDGGYYLVGLRRGFPMERRRAAYLEARLGSGSVFEHTRAALGDTVLLAPCPDVDSGAAIHQLGAELARDPSLAPNVAAWFGEHGRPPHWM
jgi:glycosyltransferase A (GT-A) superfamily protein (DUF2064 family)